MVKNGFIPETLDEALKYIKEENVKPYGGGTDLMVPEERSYQYLFLHRVPELQKIEMDDDYIRIGGSVTFSEIEESRIMPTIFKECMTHLAGPAIRNVGTIAGNIGNGSSKADSVLLLYAMDAKVRVKSSDHERIVEIDELYQEDTKLLNDELIVEVLIPNRNYERYYYHKVGPRKALAISRVDFCCIVETKQDRIINFAVAFGAIMPQIVRNKKLDEAFIGLMLEEAKSYAKKYLLAYDEFLQPKSGRVSKEYRKNASMNLLKDALNQLL